MAYSAEVIRLARQELEREKADRESQYRQRLAQAYAQVPRIKEIDLQLRQTMTLAAQAAFLKGEDAAAAMEQVKEANLTLQQERQTLIQRYFAPGWLEEEPVCNRCGGSGYVGSTMCACLQERCRQEQQKLIARLTTGQERFSAFRLDYYPEEPDPRYGVSPRRLMERNLQICKEYADTFGEKSGNLLFVGGTGLGKTFLSACIAVEVAGKGFSVAYETAPRLFAQLSKNQFEGDEQTRTEAAQYTGCDLLILDDLGTEMTNQFVIAALYSLVNDRLLSGKNTIISTNLNVEEIAQRYSPQIASRLRGCYRGLTFVGQDIRVLKNRGL